MSDYEIDSIRHDDRIYRLARQYAAQRDRDGMQRLYEAVCASIKPERRFRIIEMIVQWMVPNAELAGVLDADGEPAVKHGRRRRPSHVSDVQKLARLLVCASTDLATTIAFAAQQPVSELRAWAEQIGPDECPQAEALRQAIIEVAP